MTMKHSISSKHTSLRAAASTPLVYSAREDLISATSNTRSNAQWETFKVPTGVSVSNHRTNKLLDLAALRDSDLDKLKKSDPFMYYSIPHAKVAAARPDLTLVRPKAANGINERTASDQIRRNSSDSVLMVKRRSRISCEKHYDIEEMLEEIKELQAAQRGERPEVRLSQILDDKDEEDDNDESFSEFLYNIHVGAGASSA
jgi:hypothetical protein